MDRQVSPHYDALGFDATGLAPSAQHSTPLPDFSSCTHLSNVAANGTSSPWDGFLDISEGTFERYPSTFGKDVLEN